MSETEKKVVIIPADTDRQGTDVFKRDVTSNTSKPKSDKPPKFTSSSGQSIDGGQSASQSGNATSSANKGTSDQTKKQG